MRKTLLLIASLCLHAMIGVNLIAEELGTKSDTPSGWTFESARAEIRPDASWKASGGPDAQGVFEIHADHRVGLAGYWKCRVKVTGGQFVDFQVTRKTTGIGLKRRAAIARVIWLNDNGDFVKRREETFSSYRPGERPRAEPEFPPVCSSHQGWDQLAAVYEVPPDATQAQIELHFRWGEPESKVEWTMPSLVPTDPPASRRVRLATVHLQPREGVKAIEKCEQFVPLIAEAADKKVDLVVLPETLTYYASGGTYSDAAESVPGPSTEFFGKLAKKHDLYIVAGLVERDKHLIYNVSVLLGPDGNLIGKYRKVTLPRTEIEGGITPGDDYPVFDTRFGKIGMMICYDGFFPEVARELTNRGAEVIAWPVWGCNPMLASARACENHVYVVSSTYTDYQRDWMISAVFGHDGMPLAHAEQWGTLAIADVELNQPMYWHSLGDFQAQIQAHRPEVNHER